MSFRVMARTILQLGAELISSDSIAFYELIKNAFDAGSPKVDIDVVIRLPYDAYVSHVQYVQIEKRKKRDRAEVEEAVAELGVAIAKSIDTAAPGAGALRERISDAKTWD